MTANELFEGARKRIAVPDGVLKEARKRRDRIRDVGEEEFGDLPDLLGHEDAVLVEGGPGVA